MSAPFTARYAGHCADGDCGEPIRGGDSVQFIDGELVHEGCIPGRATDTTPRPVCGECFTEIALNGACACAS